jgi:hypothetical protein
MLAEGCRRRGVTLQRTTLILRSVELSGANPPKAPTWRASCRCLTTDSLPRGYPGQLFGLRRVLELDSGCRDSRFILVRALDCDRVIALRPVSISLCVGLIVLYCLLLQGLDREVCSYCLRSIFLSIDLVSLALLYIVQETRVLVGLQCRVLV